MPKKSKRRNDPVEREEEAFQRRVRERHIELFPEEYDYMFDSFSEARERSKGLSPMDAAYLENASQRRVAMGFKPLSDSGYATSRDTFDYVEQKMRAGEEVILPKIAGLEAHSPDSSTLEAAPSEQPQAQVSSCAVADILASDAFLSKGDDRSDPEVIAVRILGALFTLNSRGSNEPLFHKHIKKVLPGQDGEEYKRLYRVAMNEWIEAYGG
jgi:hypothetical protein